MNIKESPLKKYRKIHYIRSYLTHLLQTIESFITEGKQLRNLGTNRWLQRSFLAPKSPWLASHLGKLPCLPWPTPGAFQSLKWCSINGDCYVQCRWPYLIPGAQVIIPFLETSFFFCFLRFRESFLWRFHHCDWSWWGAAGKKPRDASFPLPLETVSHSGGGLGLIQLGHCCSTCM